MADGGDLVGGLDDALFRVHHDVQNGLNGFRVGGHGDLLLDILPAGDLVGQAAVNADTLAEALGEDLAALGLHKLILQRGTARVDYQNFHVVTYSLLSLFCYFSFPDCDLQITAWAGTIHPWLL